MVNVLLIRHGATELNEARRFQGWSDVPLTTRGLSQVRNLMESLEPVPSASVIHVSDLRRARETADVLFPDRVHRLDERLRELHFGCFEGLTAEEGQARHPEAWARWMEDADRYAPPGGETLAAFRTRIDEWVDEVLPSTPESLVVVAHGGTLGYLCQRLEAHALSPLPPLPSPGGAIQLTLHPKAL